MPIEDAAAMIKLIDERLASTRIDLQHRDALIRLRAMLEDDLAQDQDGEPD